LLDYFPNWESAIADAETQALEAEKRAVRLRAVAAVLKRKREAGEPWPQTATPLHGSNEAATQN
jgi:nitroimidazol reductase NimA-like FMN-containing flavoprotein (pyridoxamine 5'-phosphate oxidase superfamily)